MFNTFVRQDNKDPLICAMPVAVYLRDPLIRVRKEFGGPTMSLAQAYKELTKGGDPKRRRNTCRFPSFKREGRKSSWRSPSLPLRWWIQSLSPIQEISKEMKEGQGPNRGSAVEGEAVGFCYVQLRQPRYASRSFYLLMLDRML